MRGRWLDVLVVLSLTAVALGVFGRKLFEAPPGPAPSVERRAPSFSAPLVRGGTVTREGGPYAVLMTAPLSCADCRRSAAVDREAAELVRRLEVPFNPLLVGVSPQEGPALVQELGTDPDLTALDPEWKVCGMLGGSDDRCWVVVNARGEVAWQGGRDLPALEKALRQAR